MDRHETIVTGRCETFRYCHIGGNTDIQLKTFIHGMEVFNMMSIPPQIEHLDRSN